MYTLQQIDKWFTHPASVAEPQAEALTAFHGQARALAVYVFNSLPAGHEQDVALDKLQESVMWGSVAITRGGK
jgi:hypothetical protein